MNDKNDLQVDHKGRLRHFLTTEGLSRQLLTEILDTADGFMSVVDQSVKKVPLLRGRTVVNLFYEPSTRTRPTFALAPQPLSALVLPLSFSSSCPEPFGLPPPLIPPFPPLPPFFPPFPPPSSPFLSSLPFFSLPPFLSPPFVLSLPSLPSS